MKTLDLTGMEVSTLKSILLYAEDGNARGTKEQILATRLIEQLNVMEGRPFKNGLSLKQSEPLLGLATTGDLLEELSARAELGGYANYRTVDGD